MQTSSNHPTFIALYLIAALSLVGASTQYILAQVKGINAKPPNPTALSDLKSELGSSLTTEANPELAWFNLADWMSLLNRSEPGSPEEALAHVVASIFTRDTGALASQVAANSSTGYSLDGWLTEEGKQNKKKLASLDTSSPWLNTLTVVRAEPSANGMRRTYWFKGTARTSEPRVFYPIEFAVQLVKDERGKWLADDFEVSPQEWQR
jgi:hypothetical protein